MFFSTGLFFFKQRAVGVRGGGGAVKPGRCGVERAGATFVCVFVCVEVSRVCRV